jgi:hypothetical protein
MKSSPGLERFRVAGLMEIRCPVDHFAQLALAVLNIFRRKKEKQSKMLRLLL